MLEERKTCKLLRAEFIIIERLSFWILYALVGAVECGAAKVKGRLGRMKDG